MELSFEDFRKRALDKKLSKWEKIGFPDEYRENVELAIFEDIKRKLNLSDHSNLRLLDIGCGCGDLVKHFIELAKSHNHDLILVDSEEMLSNIDVEFESPRIQLVPGYFPAISSIDKMSASLDYIVIYSVIQYVFLEQSLYKFLHKCIDLLKPGGKLLIGDIPNASSRNRFLKSEAGQRFLEVGKTNKNHISIEHIDDERIDDSVIMAILSRFRQFGCETYLLPQSEGLPFDNRREDILIVKR